MPGEWSQIKSATTAGEASSLDPISTLSETMTKALPKKSVEIVSSKLETKPSNVCTYTVQSGDSLWSIARAKLDGGTKLNEIKQLNDLSSNALRVGQELKMPCAAGDVAVKKAKEELVQEGTKLDILVKDSTNKPLAGVRVTLHSKVQFAKTDKNGIAQFENVEPGDHRVILAYNDYEGEQKLTVDGSKKEQVLTLQVQMNNGFSSPWVLAVIIAMSSIIAALLLILLLGRRKRKSHE